MYQTLTPSRRNQGYVPHTQQQTLPLGGLRSVSPMQASGSMIMGAAGMAGQRFNDLMNAGPGQGNKDPQPIMRSYNSQP